MRQALAPLLCVFVCASSANADEIEAGFHAGRAFRKLHVDKDHVAVQAKADMRSSRTPELGKKAEAAFEMMGTVVVPRASVRNVGDVLGYPVWFDKEKDAVGILTHEIVVRLEPGASTEVVKKAEGFADITRAVFGTDVYLAKFGSPMSALAAANELYRRKGVLYAHPNFLVPKNWRRDPGTEPLFTHQWHLENVGQHGGTAGADIKIKQAWEITQGSEEVLVAVLDGGFQLTHPDLDGAWWRNAGEIPGNGVDDDANGYVDDVNGWNFWTKSGDVARGAVDDHGTAVAGLVAARANGVGVTGTCPGCKLIPVVVSWAVADDAAAFFYALNAGAHISTNSWGYAVGTPETDVVSDAIRETAERGRDGKGMITLFAMNNIDQDDCIGDEPDISSLPSVVAVSGASDLDKKVSFSAWGACMEYLSPTYEMNRPGIATTDLVGQRGYNNGRRPGDLADLDYTNDFGGTSAATPISAGVFGLMLSVNPDLTRDEALDLVLRNADKVQPELANYHPTTGFSQKYGYGRMNAARAVSAARAFKKYTKTEDAKPAAVR